MVLILSTAIGCVIPPPLEQDTSEDGGVNSFPSIVEIDSNFPPPGPISLNQQDQRDMTFKVHDADVEDTIWVYLFRDYNYPDPTPHLSSCQSSLSEMERDLTCPLNRMCGFVDPGDTIHVLEALVTDRELLDEGEPLYRALPDGAGFSFRSWLMTCSVSPPARAVESSQ